MKNYCVIALFITIVIVVFFTSVALANSELAFGIPWWTVDSGGGTSQSAAGQYTLNDTIGQPDVGVATGGDYILQGGFWGPNPRLSGTGDGKIIYLPLIQH